MVLITPSGKKIKVWCARCQDFVIPVYNMKGQLATVDEYLCPKCGGLEVIVGK